MAALEKNLAVKRYGPPPAKDKPTYAKYVFGLRDNGRAATDFLLATQKQLDKDFDQGDSRPGGMGVEHSGLMFFLHDLYVLDFIEVLQRLQEDRLALEVGSEIKLWVKNKITIPSDIIPPEFKKYFPNGENEPTEFSMAELMRAHRTKTIKPEIPEHFSFVSNVLIQEILSDSRFNAPFINTFFTLIVVNQKDLQLVKSKLAKQTPFNSMQVMDELITAAELIKKFGDVFLASLVNIDHPSHLASRELFDAFMADYFPGMNLTENNLPAFVTSGIAQALMSRSNTAEGQRRMNSSPGDWLIRLSELDDLSPHTDERYGDFSEAIADCIEIDISRRVNFVLNTKTFLANIPQFSDKINALNKSNTTLASKGAMILDGLFGYKTIKAAITQAIRELGLGFDPVEPTTFALSELQKQFPHVDSAKPIRTTLTSPELQLSEKIKSIFPLIQSIEVSSQSTPNQEIVFTFLVKSVRDIPEGSVEEYFSFSILSTATESTVLPDLIDIKQAEDSEDDLVITTISMLLAQLGSQTLESLNQKNTPKEKPAQTKISGVIISGLSGPSRPTKVSLPKKSKPDGAANIPNSQAPESGKPYKALLSTDNLDSFDLSRFGAPAREVADKIKQAVDHWNAFGNLGQSRLRSRENKYRISCMVGKVKLRIFFEMLPDSTSKTGKKLVITEIRKRTESTYKGLS